MSQPIASASPATATGSHTVRNVIAATIGHGLENYSYGVYALMAGIISGKYFPAEDPTVSMLLTTGTFAASFLARPLGAVVLGAYADRKGRIPAMVVCIRLMFLGSILMALAPTYQSIGMFAPALMLLALLVNGFSYGGEFASATAFLIEQNPKRRGFFGSWVITSQAVASLVAAGMLAALSHGLPKEAFETWGWRIPLAFGVLVGPVGYYLRRKLPDSPEFRAHMAQVPAERQHPLGEVLRTQKAQMLVIVGLVAGTTSITYMVSYLPTVGVRELGMPASVTYTAAMVGYAVTVLVVPIMGQLSDQFGRVRVMRTGIIAFAVVVYPLFLLLSTRPTLFVMITVLVLIAIITNAYIAPNASFKAEVFPLHTRGTGMSLGYNIGVVIFGGATPLIATWLIRATGTPTAPSLWLIVAAVLSIIAVVYGSPFAAKHASGVEEP